MPPIAVRSDSCGGSSDEFTTSTATTTTTTTTSLLTDDSCRSTISVASSCSSVSTSSTCSSSSSSASSGRWKTTLNAWKALKEKTSTTLVIRKFGKRRRRRRRLRSVSFSDEPPLIIPTLTRHEYTKEEIDSCWFSESTLEKTIEKCKNMINNKVNAKNGKSYCLRGLEKLSLIGNDIMTCNRNDGYDAVLYKKKSHYEDLELWNLDDHLNYDDWICSRYKTVSERCTKRALKLAQQDEIDAAKYLSSSKSSSKKKKNKSKTKKKKKEIMTTTREIQTNNQ